MFKKSKFKLSLPYLDFYLRLPLLTVQTDLFVQRHERYTYEYIGLRIQLWKWEWMFRLYKPGRSR